MKNNFFTKMFLAFFLSVYSFYALSANSVQQCDLSAKDALTESGACSHFIAGFVEALHLKNALIESVDIERSNFEKRAMKTRKLRTNAGVGYSNHDVCFPEEYSKAIIIQSVLDDLNATATAGQDGFHVVYAALKARFPCG